MVEDEPQRQLCDAHSQLVGDGLELVHLLDVGFERVALAIVLQLFDKRSDVDVDRADSMRG